MLLLPRSKTLGSRFRRQRRSSASDASLSAMKTYTNPVYAYARSPDQDAPPRRRPVVVVGAGPVGLAAAIDLAQRDVPVVVLDDDNTVSVGSRAICYAKRALEILDRLGCGERDRRQGRRAGTSARCSSATSSSTRSTCCRSRAISGRRSSICSNTSSRSISSSALAELAVRRAALAEQGRRASRRRPTAPCCASPRRTANTALSLRLADRRRRRAQPGARDAGPRSRGPGVPRSLPDRRHPHEVGFSDGALVLVRSAVPSEPVGAAASAGRRRLARSISSSGWDADPGRGEEARADPAAAARDAGRRRRVRDRMGERLHVPVPADEAFSPRPRAVRRRRGASGVAVRRARRQQRHPGRRQSGLEADARAATGSRRSGCSTATTSSARPRPTRTS